MDKKKKPYSFEEITIELVRRGLLTVDEGKECMKDGIMSEEIEERMLERIEKDPEADIPGSKRIASTQEHMKWFLKIRSLINPYMRN
jgi:polyhydroxyalkanoate synthesis regulator phasin